MRLIEFGHVPAGELPESMPIDAEVTHLRVNGAGVTVTLIQRPGEGIDIVVNPDFTPYMHHIKVGESAVSSIQVRLTGVQGSPLG